MVPNGILIGYLSPGEVRVEFASTLTNATAYALTHDIPLVGTMPRLSGPRIASARNKMVEGFLASQAEWLFMVDTDMTMPTDVLERFLKVADKDKAPIIGGLCFGRGVEGLFPTIYNWTGQGFTRPEGWDPNTMVPCDGTGAACLFVHRSVFEKIGEHFKAPFQWFQEGLTLDDGQEIGEDMAFCMRARSLDFPIFVHTGIPFGHVKEFEIDNKFYRDWVKSHRAIVTGTGRCGTGYISRVLQKAKVPADHERFFNPWHHEFPEWGRADVSWLAAPFLARYSTAHVVHLVRNPLDTISSLVGIKLFEDLIDDETWEENTAPYREFIRAHCPEVFEFDDPIERACEFYVRWNEMIEPHAIQRIRVEDQVTGANLRPVAVAAGGRFSDRHLDAAISQVPTDVNSRPSAGLTIEDLSEAAILKGKEYGYE